MTFKITPNSSQKTYYIDLAHCLSIMNRKMFRQGLYYHVQSVTLHDTDQDATVNFSVAPDTWVTKNAWSRGFKMWSKMNSQAAAALGQNDLAIAGAYHDYKIYLTYNHKQNYANSLTPVREDGTEFSRDDDGNILTDEDTWNYSEYISVDDDLNTIPNAFFAHLLGFHATDGNGDPLSVGLIKSYSDSRGTVEDNEPNIPNEINTDFLNMMFDVEGGQEQVIADLEVKNDGPPYAPNTYIGQASNDLCLMSRTAVSTGANGAGELSHGPGFIAPMGLIQVDFDGIAGGDVYFDLEVSPGMYHGVAAARVI